MLVYGDHSRRLDPHDLLASIDDCFSASGAGPIEAHGRLVAALIVAGQFAQALADRNTRETGLDRTDPAERRLMALTLRLADAAGRSWSSGFATRPDPADLAAQASAVLDGGETIEAREPEGYTQYALYPETYWQAALAWNPGPQAQVIGIRSIGTSLSAMVAAAVGAEVPWTVRPVGHPFDRRLGVDPGFAAQFQAEAATPIAIVDEGPGLSGSSFGAVADMLHARGVEPARITLFPSHGNDPGPQASPAHLARWRASRRLVQGFDELLLAPGPRAHRLESWFEDLTGPAAAPLRDIAGGRWRDLRDADPSRWPPADPAGERRKFLLATERGDYLLKFSGLGRSGMQRFAMQRALGDAGFAVPPLAWRHGFTLEPWRGDLTPFRPGLVDRDAVVERLAAYLGFRASRLPAEGRSGATLDVLLDMVVVNAGEALGPAAAHAAEARRAGLCALLVRPVATDNRLHGWEWLVDRAGTLIKTDVVDHHAGHDLIGCQDIAWDVAGVAVEFALADDEVGLICRRVALARGTSIDRDLLAFCRLAYPAFQFGAAHLAADRGDEAERHRWLAQAERYRSALQDALN